MVSDTIPPTQPTDDVECGCSSGCEPEIIAETSVAPGIIEEQQHEVVEAGTQSLIKTLHDNW